MMGSWSRPKGVSKGAQNKELTRGSGPGADLYKTRPEDDVTKAAQIGNLLGIDWEWRQLFNCEDKRYTEVERRQD